VVVGHQSGPLVRSVLALVERGWVIRPAVVLNPQHIRQAVPHAVRIHGDNWTAPGRVADQAGQEL